jgi:hypothetical protein
VGDSAQPRAVIRSGSNSALPKRPATHCPSPRTCPPPQEDADPRAHSTWADSRPPRFESDAIALLAEVLSALPVEHAPGFLVHVAHLADGGSLAALQVGGEGEGRG